MTHYYINYECPTCCTLQGKLFFVALGYLSFNIGYIAGHIGMNTYVYDFEK